MGFGTPHHHYRLTDSTNTRGRELAASGAPHGTVVTASEQTAGRGRQGRTWTAPPDGALLYSAIVRPLSERHAMLPLAVPIAVCEAAEELAPGIECLIKWPNDIHLEGRKLAGILIEARPQDGWAVIGIGLNLSISKQEFPPDLRDTAISLFGNEGEGLGGSQPSLPAVARAGSPTALPTATAALNRHLEDWVERGPHEVLGAWRERDALRGREIAWEGGSGIAGGVDDSGYLLVLTASGDRVALGAGEVHLTSF
jgi:BirA family biotin operon repressor/biotin-[acetyl-CoA-carboxylase] ligase